MAAKISTITELFHRFHICEMQLKQGKIAACLIAFREIIEKMPAIPKTEKEKGELHAGIELFLKNLSGQKKFLELFGEVNFGDTDLETNLEFVKSMIIAQEEEIIERVRKDEETAEFQRLEIDREAQRKVEETQKKIAQVIALIDAEDLPAATEILKEDSSLPEAVVSHYNDLGMQKRRDGVFPEAISHYTKALGVAPDDENLHYNMARANFEAGDTFKAEDVLGKAMKLNPEFEEGKLFYAYLLKLNRQNGHSPEETQPAEGFFGKILKKVQNLKKMALDRKAKIDNGEAEDEVKV
jgi:tetratricopeptide (TPR) repeat protein